MGADPEIRRKYTPYPIEGWPQIIQNGDYPTIRFIEAWYGEVSAIAPRQDFRITVDAELEGEAIRFHARGSHRKTLLIRPQGGNIILVGDRRFTNEATRILYATLIKVLTDLTREEKCREVRFVQYGARAYKKQTHIGFDFGARVLEIASLSNGPDNDERLYILDLVERKYSFFWSHDNS